MVARPATHLLLNNSEAYNLHYYNTEPTSHVHPCQLSLEGTTTTTTITPLRRLLHAIEPDPLGLGFLGGKRKGKV